MEEQLKEIESGKGAVVMGNVIGRLKEACVT
jgi:hypothetical protein